MDTKAKRRKKPINGLSVELMEAVEREYKEWQNRVHSEDPTLPAPLSADDLFMLESGRIPVATVTRLRKMIFSDLVSRGFQETEVCQRLLLSHKTYLRLVKLCFDISDVKNLRAHCHARTLERLGKLREQRRRMETIAQQHNWEFGVSKGDFTNAERSTYLQIIKLENELEASLRKMHAADAPEQVEVKETKTIAVTLSISGTREQLAGLLDSPEVIEAASEPLLLEIPDGR